MTQRLESAERAYSRGQLLLRGLALLTVTLVLSAVAIAKSEGVFSDRVEVTAMLGNVGDGLPSGSDVKFRGALVGTVEDVSPSIDGRPNEVVLSLDPHFAQAIPANVTARVVPSNVFAVSSIQLVDNGPAPTLRAGSQITQDESLATVQFQTALTKLRDVMAAAGRPGSDNTVGVLAAVAEATSGRGEELSRAGGGANRIVKELNAQMAAGGDEPTLAVLSEALEGLQGSSPELVEAVHNAVVPMRTVAEKRRELARFLSAGHTTFGTVGEAFENNTDNLIVITTGLSPVLGVLADAEPEYAPMVTRIHDVVNRFFTHVWKADRNTAVGKFLLVFTPNKMYTRQDCPRYGHLEAPSCRTAPLTTDPPVLPRVADPRNYPPPPPMSGGNVGSVGSPAERAQLAEILGPEPNAVSELLLGPVARGSTVQVIPDPAGTAAGPPPAAEAAPPTGGRP
ncbi:MlaD family protein [Mycolicibacterium diernhoferi]|uniref:MCE family protein n=1 Tax=Mycolicibacterium diernhoferi TaxID=1801 RepID=A0A1Q4HGG5_9MYCO|nr:MCE family protein [Mycolicibacterium diernhoferi]OJZ66575.1 mammalian cell entry protein [Mycolicibacterium diernhoferi]OPE54431.1 mammalian cell entry protein [Mycolicibacterium diernhoferi]PEG56451.1 MCE family protein [Mycolicibacterium diernhoferi]QYL24757.1 MCE family protein [Mycolicibacterium diernhoferi]